MGPINMIITSSIIFFLTCLELQALRGVHLCDSRRSHKLSSGVVDIYGDCCEVMQNTDDEFHFI